MVRLGVNSFIATLGMSQVLSALIIQRSDNRQINDGYVILCVARPMSDCTLEVGVESHDKLYRNPFLDPLAPHELKADIAVPLEKQK